MPTMTDLSEKKGNSRNVTDLCLNTTNFAAFNNDSEKRRGSVCTQKHYITTMPLHLTHNRKESADTKIVLTKNQIEFSEQVKKEREHTAAKVSSFAESMQGKAHSPRVESKPMVHPRRRLVKKMTTEKPTLDNNFMMPGEINEARPESQGSSRRNRTPFKTIGNEQMEGDFLPSPEKNSVKSHRSASKSASKSAKKSRPRKNLSSHSVPFHLPTSIG